ncbi:tetratricopeptide repeat protein [Micromonospora rosaria]|uniref:tetratricopeptide repeat protein n=1 Tax=Micromonospora rosaria TaxID=47874 RepID=UPI0037CC3E6C
MSLAKPVAETVARHLVATGKVIDEDPAEALAHALAARRLAARISAVREAVGLAAYHAGEWQTAIAELRTYHRMSGVQSHLAVLADCERALGRPERAIDLFRGADRDTLEPAVAIELLIVAAGARGDLGQKDAAVAMLQVRELTSESTEPWTARLRYAYADALLAVDRREEAREWFSRAADADAEGETDAAERLLELDGVVIEGDDDEDELPVEDEVATGPGAPGAVPERPDAELRADGSADDADPTAEPDTGDLPAEGTDSGPAEPVAVDQNPLDQNPGDQDPADRNPVDGATVTRAGDDAGTSPVAGVEDRDAVAGSGAGATADQAGATGGAAAPAQAADESVAERR